MLKKLLFLGIAVAAFSSSALPAKATFSYIDDPNSAQNDGDLSNNRLNPTNIGTLMKGQNNLFITINNQQDSTLDLEYFTVNVPNDLVLSKINLTFFSQSTGDPPNPDDVAFIGMQEGDQMTVAPPTSADDAERSAIAAELLGHTLVGTNPADSVIKPNNNILPSMCLTENRPPQPSGQESFPPMGCDVPLTGGKSYTFWVQQTSITSNPVQFELEFTGNNVPEPVSILGSLILGAFGLGSKIIKLKSN
jgi:hypothetical protein